MKPASTATEAAAIREYQFDDGDFHALRELVKRMTGINLADSKRELVYGRVSRRLRVLGLKSFGEYRQLLQAENAPELVEFCNALTTNLTSFFRESHHFDHFGAEILQARADDPGASRRVRIWSAACSTGEEPYSIAMTICESLDDWQRWDIKILATDLDSNVLATAALGVYAAERVRGLSPQRLARFFRERSAGSGQSFEVVPELKQLVAFKHLNLMHPLPMKGPFDAIYCRNVIIYFDKPTQRELFARVARVQRPGDTLYLGHSENLFNVSDAYTLIGRTIYRRASP